MRAEKSGRPKRDQQIPHVGSAKQRDFRYFREQAGSVAWMDGRWASEAHHTRRNTASHPGFLFCTDRR